MGLGQFYAFAAVIAYLCLFCCGMLVLAHKMGNAKIVHTLRVLIVLFTICAFMNIFIDDMYFADFENEELHTLHYGPNYNATTNATKSNATGSGKW